MPLDSVEQCFASTWHDVVIFNRSFGISAYTCCIWTKRVAIGRSALSRVRLCGRLGRCLLLCLAPLLFIARLGGLLLLLLLLHPLDPLLP